MKCPKCGNENLARSRRRGIEISLRYSYPFAPYRCMSCWNRFWAFRISLKSLVSKVIAGTIIFCIVLSFALYRRYLSLSPDSQKIMSTNMWGISGDIYRGKVLPSKAQNEKKLTPPDYPEKEYSKRPVPGVEEETVLEGKPMETKAAKKKIVSKEKKGPDAPNRDGAHNREHDTKVYSLHISSYKQKINAEKKVRIFKKDGYKAFFAEEQVLGERWFRVYISAFHDEKEARKAGSKLRGKGIISYFKPVKIYKNTLSSIEAQNPGH